MQDRRDWSKRKSQFWFSERDGKEESRTEKSLVEKQKKAFASQFKGGRAIAPAEEEWVEKK